MCVLSTDCVYYYVPPSAGGAPPPPVAPAPQITFVSTFSITLPDGVTTLTASEKNATCLSVELSLNAPVGSCVFLGTYAINATTSPSAAPSPTAMLLASRAEAAGLTMMLAAYSGHDRHHSHLLAPAPAKTNKLLAKTKIVAEANRFQSYAATKNVTLLFNSLKDALNVAVANGTLTQAIQANSVKFNASATATAVVDPSSATVAPVTVIYAPTFPPTFAPSGSAESFTVSTSNNTGEVPYGLIGGLVGGFVFVVVAAFLFLMMRRGKTVSRQQSTSGSKLMNHGVASAPPPHLLSNSSDSAELIVDRVK
jgi:hypothetical protein